MDITFLDVETLGLDPDAPIWEFAAVRRRKGLPDHTINFLVEHDPGDWVQTLPAAFQDDYRTRFHDSTAVTEGTAATEIHFATNGAILVGCNPGFDIERLTKLLQRNGIEPAWHYHPLDIASAAIGYLAGKGFPPQQPWKSDQLADMVGITTANYQRHTALGDVLWTAAQWDQIMSGGA